MLHLADHLLSTKCLHVGMVVISIACVGLELENASTFSGVSSMPKARPPTKARGVSFRNLAHRPRSIRRGCHRHQYLSERGMWPLAPPNLCNQVGGDVPGLACMAMNEDSWPSGSPRDLLISKLKFTAVPCQRRPRPHSSYSPLVMRF